MYIIRTRLISFFYVCTYVFKYKISRTIGNGRIIQKSSRFSFSCDFYSNSSKEFRIQEESCSRWTKDKTRTKDNHKKRMNRITKVLSVMGGTNIKTLICFYLRRKKRWIYTLSISVKNSLSLFSEIYRERYYVGKYVKDNQTIDRGR